MSTDIVSIRYIGEPDFEHRSFSSLPRPGQVPCVKEGMQLGIRSPSETGAVFGSDVLRLHVSGHAYNCGLSLVTPVRWPALTSDRRRTFV